MIGLAFFLAFIPVIIGILLVIIFHSSRLKYLGYLLILITAILLLVYAIFFMKGLNSIS